MSNKFIKSLALASYTKELLDEVKIGRIVKKLTRLELKTYIKALKTVEKQKNVYVYLANTADKLITGQLNKLFPDKKIVIKEDKSLIAGIRIVDNDRVYEHNIKNNLNNLVNFINQ
jgi:F0F1-type ATP synthase delta subunit